MQAPLSLGVVGSILGLALLALVLAVTIWVPLLGLAIFFFGLLVFALWRSRRHVKPESLRERERVPSTEETAGDPFADSGAGVVARRGSRH